MKIQICRRYIQIFGIISVLSFSNLVYAETVVHNERIIQQDIQKKQEIARAEREKKKKEELEQKKAEEEKRRKEDLEFQKEQEEKQALNRKNTKKTNNKDSITTPNANKNNITESQKDRIIENNDYLRLRA